MELPPSLAGELGLRVLNVGLGMSSNIERMGLCSAGVVFRLLLKHKQKIISIIYICVDAMYMYMKNMKGKL